MFQQARCANEPQVESSRENLAVSVLIPTKNRPSDLALTIKTLLQQTVAPDELIIVDQSDSVDSRQVIDQILADVPFHIREKLHLHYVRASELPGLTWARNRAMEIAQGDIWLFLDDDVVLEENFLEELLYVCQHYPEFDGVSGIITNYELPSLPFRLWNSIFVRGPFRDERQFVYWNAPRLNCSDPIPVRKLGGGLMSFRARAIRGMRFDENLRGVSDGEDVDFCARMRPGAQLAIAPRARLIHNASLAGRSRKHWLQRSTQANCYLFQRNWNTCAFNRMCFLWLMAGLGIIALFASLRRGSLEPWNTFRQGALEGYRVSGVGLRRP